MFECVINISEGADEYVLGRIEKASGESLRDRHSDSFHNRSVFTLINDETPLLRDVHSLITTSVDLLDLRQHEGVHPRFGVVDVVPFVALNPAQFSSAVRMRDEVARWMGETLEIPVFLYGGERSLPDVRREAFGALAPDFGPATPSVLSGACAVGARPPLVAWNLWLEKATLAQARLIARQIRSESVRALGLEVGNDVQVSCNLVDLEATKPSLVYDAVVALLPEGASISHAELVGLCPKATLLLEEASRWDQLGLSQETTIEERSNA